MYTIAVLNQKGGCGKTTTAVNLAAGLAARGRRTLLVDLDPQAHASLALGHVDDGSERSLYDVLVDPLVPITQIIAAKSENLDLAPGTVILHAAEQVLAGAAQRENRLRRKLESVASQYHYAIIDSPPAVGLLTVNALSSADLALVTVEASYFALHGMARLFETIEMVRRETGREIAVRALCTLFDSRTRLAQEVYDEIRRHLGDTMYKSIIRVNVKLREAASHGKAIFSYARHSKGAEDYAALADEVIRGEPGAEMIPEAAVTADDAAMEQILTRAKEISERVIPFTIYAPHAESVFLAADWNGWSGTATPLVADPSTGIWSTQSRVPPGRHAYRFMVDGIPLPDPANDLVSIGPAGERNSVIEDDVDFDDRDEGGES